ncbi:MAG: BlaI/MecI/CopY family transcriptional regulator [Oscillospiraceae bacterium]|nr:BlaI/MecI/CopY family transcriptional regulator [Oscillospiraceae bacterium]
MSNKKMGVLESRFADFIWNNEPITSGQLVKMAEKELNWKSTTSYTVLKRLCERGIFQNKDGAVTSLISREEFYALQSEQFVAEAFDGSLPAFLAAFGTRRKMSEAEIDELKKIIDGFRR